MKTVYAYGNPVPEDILKEIEVEYGKEYCNTEFIETLYETLHIESVCGFI